MILTTHKTQDIYHNFTLNELQSHTNFFLERGRDREKRERKERSFAHNLYHILKSGISLGQHLVIFEYQYFL